MTTPSVKETIPEGWIERTLDSLVRMSGGGTPSKSNPTFWNGEIPWLSSGDIKNIRISKGSDSITQLGLENSSSKLCPPGSVVIVVRSGVLKHTLPVAVLEQAAAINQDLRCLDSGDSLLNEWVALTLRTCADQILERNREGTTVQSVRSETLREWPVPLPPLAEQRRIVAKVEALQARVQAARQRLDRVPKILKRFRQAVLAAACNGQLTTDWREAHQCETPIQSLIPEGLPTDELPETWAVVPFGAYIENHDSGRVPIRSTDRKVRHGEFPYYGASGIIDSIDGFTHDGEFLLIGEDGANLLSRSTPIAFIARGQFWVNNHAHVVRPVHGLPNQYLAHFVNSIDLQPYVTGSAQPKLTQANMNSIPINVPPEGEQREIVRRVEALFKLADAIERRVTTAAARADRLTQAILAKAFRGELVPTEAELAGTEGRDYETAEQLLARIRQAPKPAPNKRKPKSTSGTARTAR